MRYLAIGTLPIVVVGLIALNAANKQAIDLYPLVLIGWLAISYWLIHQTHSVESYITGTIVGLGIDALADIVAVGSWLGGPWAWLGVAGPPLLFGHGLVVEWRWDLGAGSSLLAYGVAFWVGAVGLRTLAMAIGVVLGPRTGAGGPARPRLGIAALLAGATAVLYLGHVDDGLRYLLLGYPPLLRRTPLDFADLMPILGFTWNTRLVDEVAGLALIVAAIGFDWAWALQRGRAGRPGRAWRPWLRGVGGLLVLGLAVGVAWPRPAQNRLSIDGQPFFLAGVNYPWKTGEDFGTGGWGHSGVSNPTTYQEVDTDFANMEAMGVRAVKWRVFQDGRYGITFDANGTPTGLDPYVFPDTDAAIRIARAHHIYLIFTLFDSGLWTSDCTSQGVQLGGHADLLIDPAKRQALVDRVVNPFAHHVAASHQVIAYEVIAEPDWGVATLNTQNDGRLKLSLDQVRAFVRALVGGIRSQTNALVTVEANRPRNLTAWRGLGLDYYSFSWYDWMAPYDPLNRPASSYGLHRPIVLGEFPAQSQVYSLPQVMNLAYRQGYAGALAWSFGGVDQYGSVVDVRDGYTRWLDQHWPAVALFAPTTPKNDVALLPPPYAVLGTQNAIDRGQLSVQVRLFIRSDQEEEAKLYATPIGQTTPVAQAGDVAAPDAEGQAAVRMLLGGLNQTQPYKLSLGLFTSDGKLIKWFDDLSNVELQQGTVQTPNLQALALENPCHG